MRIRRKQHIILVLFATRNFICCDAARCKSVEDINPPTCNIEDLKDGVLKDICENVGYHYKPVNSTREELVYVSQLCHFGKVKLDRIKDKEEKKRVQKTVLDDIDKAITWDAVFEPMYVQYLDMMKNDASFLGMSRHDRISYLLSKHGIKDVEVKAKIQDSLIEKLEENDASKKVEEQAKSYGPTPEEIAKLPKWKDRNTIISLGDWYVRAFQKEGKVVTAQWRDTSQTWTRPTRITELEYKKGDGMYWWDGINALDFVRKSIQYEYASVFEFRGIQKKSVLIGYNYGDDPYVTAKRTVDEYELNTIYIYKIIRLLLETEAVIEQKMGVPPKEEERSVVAEQSYGPSPEEIVKLPKWSLNNQFTGLIEGQIKIFQTDGQPVISGWNVENQIWSKPAEITQSDYKNGYNGLDTDDLIRKSIQYDHALAFQMDLSEGTMNILIGHNNGDDPLVTAQTVIDEYKLDKSNMVVLADSIRQYIRAGPPLSYIVSGAGSKHINGRYNLNIRDNGELWYRKQIPTIEPDPEDGKKLSIMRCTMKDKTKSWVISWARGEHHCTDDDINYYNNISELKLPPTTSNWYKCEHCIGTYPMPKLAIGIPLDEQGGRRGEGDRPTPKEISKLPKWKNKFLQTPKSLVGLGKRQVKLFQKGGKIVTAEWRARTQTWSEFTVITDFHYENGFDGWDILDLMRKSIQYEHALTYRSEEENLIIGYNDGDDPFVTAQATIEEHSWNKKYTGSIADFIREAGEVINPAIPQTKTEAYQITLILVITMIGFIYLLSYEYVSQRKKSPKKDSRLTCHQPITEKKIYVKLSATKRLNGNQGRKLEGLRNKSGVEDIELERKTGQPTVMNKIEASNGVVYVPVHIKGGEEAVQKATVLIQQAIGEDNVDKKIELPPTKPQQTKSTTPKPKSTTTSKVSSAPPKIPKKKKSTSSSLSSTIWSSICASYQSLRTMTINTHQSAKSSIRNLFSGARLSFGDLMYWALAALLMLLFDMNKIVGLLCFAIPCIEHHVLRPMLMLVVTPGCIILLKWKIDFNELVISGYYYLQQKAAQIVSARLYSQPNIIPNYTFFTSNTDQSKTEDAYWITLFLALAILSWFCALSYEYVSQRSKRPPSLIYVKSTKAKELKVQQNKKMKEIVNKSGLDKVLIEPTAVGDNYTPIQMIGSRRSLWKAIELIQEAVGAEHVSIEKPSNTVSVQESVSATVNTSEPQPNQKSTTESPVQCETKIASGNNITKEASTTTKSPPTTLQVKKEEEEVPSEIGIDSCQGMTRETITEASISSLNDRSNISKAYSNFTTLNEDDPLLIFLRSQESCIKGSVDEFYTWLVKSEDIDSMLALKEAVNEDDYLNDMKVGDGGGSGIKGFKRKAFLRAISEYFHDESDTKSTTEDHQSLPQCQKKIPSETLEPPEELVCPISLNLMTNDPVVAADGITYERASIEDWFKKSRAKIRSAEENLKQNPQSEADQRVVENGICSPVYGTKMESLTLMPNTILRNMARAFKEK